MLDSFYKDISAKPINLMVFRRSPPAMRANFQFSHAIAVAICSSVLLRARPLKRSFPPTKSLPSSHGPQRTPGMAEEQMEDASTAAAASTPFQLQFDKPIPFQV